MGHGAGGRPGLVRAADDGRRSRARAAEPLAVDPLAAPRDERAPRLRVAARAGVHHRPRSRGRGRPVHPFRPRSGSGAVREPLPPRLDEPGHRRAVPAPRSVGQHAPASPDRSSALAPGPLCSRSASTPPRRCTASAPAATPGRSGPAPSTRGASASSARCWRSGSSHLPAVVPGLARFPQAQRRPSFSPLRAGRSAAPMRRAGRRVREVPLRGRRSRHRRGSRAPPAPRPCRPRRRSCARRSPRATRAVSPWHRSTTAAVSPSASTVR